jgi:hypothetical protein
MMVIMDHSGKFAKVNTVESFEGVKKVLYWVDLNDATLFPDKIQSKDYGPVFNKLMNGIFVAAKEERTVTLLKNSNT